MTLGDYVIVGFMGLVLIGFGVLIVTKAVELFNNDGED